MKNSFTDTNLKSPFKLLNVRKSYFKRNNITKANLNGLLNTDNNMQILSIVMD